MIPTHRFAWLFALGLPIVLLGLFGRTGLIVAGGYDLLLVGAACFDRVTAADPRRLVITREAPERMVQGRPETIALHARWRGPRTLRCIVRDLPSAAFTSGSRTLSLTLRPGGGQTIAYEVCPRERGTHSFEGLAIRSRGVLGLVQRQAIVSMPGAVRVYPDLLSLSAREAALVSPAAWRGGMRRAKTAGEGREFHQLRDYTPGDDARFLDWKAFAHRGRPVVREYRAERNQRVLLVLDAGRLMTAHVGDRLRFDWAVQAAGRLARVALAMGDLVGVAVYSRDLKATLPPARGPGHLAEIAEILSQTQPDLDEPDLRRALHPLLAGHPRRTLVVLFTELADQRASRAVMRSIGALTPRHLGLIVTLADADLEREKDAPFATIDGAYRRAAAEEVYQDSVRTTAALMARGALVVRARADALAGETVARYVELKRVGRL